MIIETNGAQIAQIRLDITVKAKVIVVKGE